MVLVVLCGREVRALTVTDVALEFGFWHLGHFAEQYNKLLGESPHETPAPRRQRNQNGSIAELESSPESALCSSTLAHL